MRRELPDLKRRAEILIDELEKLGFAVDAVYLFGSHARGEQLKTSDIDLIVVSKDFDGVPVMKRLDIVNRIIWERGLGNLEVLPLTPEEIDRSVVARDAKKYWIRLV